jgi:erythromycin esterase
MKFISAAPPPANPVDVKAASATWSGIVEHMESMRETYTKKGAAAREIDWSIQNARVVLQCMQMYANQVTRDESMAQNIKWILDHSPQDKLVVWAHNGHVKAGGEGYASMGASLRKMYGDQMVVFGFAFNQGSFRAVELQKSLHEWTVPAAPEGSLDATLAATKIPLLALDLRKVPKAGPVADWWGQPHKTRSIGAVYSDRTAEMYLANVTLPQSYDVILFVETTTAARGNTPTPAPAKQ